MFKFVFVILAFAGLTACSSNSSSDNNSGGGGCGSSFGASAMCMPGVHGDRKAAGTLVGWWLDVKDAPAFKLTLEDKFDEACKYFVTEKNGGRMFTYGLATSIMASGEIQMCDQNNDTVECLSMDPRIFVDLNTGALKGPCPGKLTLSGDMILTSVTCNGKTMMDAYMAVSEAGYKKYLQGAFYCGRK